MVGTKRSVAELCFIGDIDFGSRARQSSMLIPMGLASKAIFSLLVQEALSHTVFWIKLTIGT